MRIHAVRTSSPVTSIHDPRLSPRHQAATWAHAHRNLLRHQGTYQSLVGQDGDGDGGGEGEGEPLQSTAQTGNESAALAPTVPPAPPATPQNLRPWAGLAEGHEAGPMAYHGGPVLSDPLTVYLIYYGNWTEGMGQVVFEEFIHALSNSSVNDQVSGCEGTTGASKGSAHGLPPSPLALCLLMLASVCASIRGACTPCCTG